MGVSTAGFVNDPVDSEIKPGTIAALADFCVVRRQHLRQRPWWLPQLAAATLKHRSRVTAGTSARWLEGQALSGPRSTAFVLRHAGIRRRMRLPFGLS